MGGAADETVVSKQIIAILKESAASAAAAECGAGHGM
jgi:hypothetical protein